MATGKHRSVVTETELGDGLLVRAATPQDLPQILAIFNQSIGGKQVSIPLTNPIGCNVKWAGKDAKWMPPEACDLVPREES